MVIQIALRNMLVRVGADVTGLRKGMEQANKSVASFGRNLKGSLGGIKGQIAGAMAGIGAGLVLQGGIEDAMKYEALMATLGESMGKSRKDFERWSETVGQSMGFSRLESAKLANTLSLNFKQIATSQEDLVNKTTKMMEMAGIIANKRGITMQEVSDRIRSAMNQEADGADELGVNVRIAAIKQSEAYKTMADGKPWDQLTQNMQKTILYEHILQQVTQNLGSSLQDTTQLRMATFTASLQDVKMALGQAFLPILYSILPTLTKLMQWLYKTLQVVSAFMSALFGGFKYKAQTKGTEDQTKATQAQAKAVTGLGNATEKAGKKAKKAGKEAKGGVAGFDEVNLLADKAGGADGGGGGGGAGGAGAMPVMPEFVPPDSGGFMEGVNKLVEKFKKKLEPIKEFFKGIWDYISSYFQIKFYGIIGWWKENGDMIIQAMKNVWAVVGPIVGFIVKFIWDSVKGLIDGVIRFFEGLIEFISGVLTGNWGKAWDGLVKMVFGAVQAIWNFFNLTLFGGIKKLLVSLIKDGAVAFIKFAEVFKKPITAGFREVEFGIHQVFDGISLIWKTFSKFIKGETELVVGKLFNNWARLKTIWGEIVGAMKTAWGGVYNWFARTVITPIVNRLQDIKDAFKHGIGEGLLAVLRAIVSPLNGMIKALNKIKNNLPVVSGLPDIPTVAFAKGGIVSRATLGLVGEAGPEAIAPLDKLQGFVTNAVLTAMKLQGNQGGSADIVLNLDGKQFARIVKPFLDRENKRVGNNIRLQT